MFKHEIQKTIINGNTKVWRYLKINRFEQLLENSALYFSSLNEQEMDPNEHEYTPKDLEIFHSFLSNNYNEKEQIMYRNDREYFNNQQKKFILINCWSHGENEIFDHWKNGDFDLVIQSEHNILQSSFTENSRIIEIIPVNYIDREIDYSNTTTLWRFKNNKKNTEKNLKDFSYENELRIIALPNNFVDGNQQLRIIKGEYKKINLNLIKQIRTHPLKYSDLYDKIKTLIEKYKLNVEIQKSEFADE